MSYETWGLVQEWDLTQLQEKLGEVKVQEEIWSIRGVRKPEKLSVSNHQSGNAN